MACGGGGGAKGFERTWGTSPLGGLGASMGTAAWPFKQALCAVCETLESARCLHGVEPPRF